MPGYKLSLYAQGHSFYQHFLTIVIFKLIILLLFTKAHLPCHASQEHVKFLNLKSVGIGGFLICKL